MSCGALLTLDGVIKYPPGNNYLDGATVTFTCKPEYFIHGDPQRMCINGTWTPGWQAWCRSRTVELGLKWMTGILSTTAIIMFIASIFCSCYMRRIALHPETRITFRKSSEFSDSTRQTIISHPPLKTIESLRSEMQPKEPVSILRKTARSPQPQPEPFMGMETRA